jgi:hypothetical protein
MRLQAGVRVWRDDPLHHPVHLDHVAVVDAPHVLDEGVWRS